MTKFQCWKGHWNPSAPEKFKRFAWDHIVYDGSKMGSGPPDCNFISDKNILFGMGFDIVKKLST